MSQDLPVDEKGIPHARQHYCYCAQLDTCVSIPVTDWVQAVCSAPDEFGMSFGRLRSKDHCSVLQSEYKKYFVLLNTAARGYGGQLACARPEQDDSVQV